MDWSHGLSRWDLLSYPRVYRRIRDQLASSGTFSRGQTLDPERFVIGGLSLPPPPVWTTPTRTAQRYYVLSVAIFPKAR